MSKTAMIRARIEPNLKKQVEEIFSKLGLTTTEAITLFYSLVSLNNGLPFEIKIPNNETIQTFNDTDNGKNITECDAADDMFDKLGI